jgi:hypothetical protein
MDEGIFIADQNQLSGRYAYFDDDGVSGWLYMTNPNEKKLSYHCWIYNRINPPDPSEIIKYKYGPPPASSNVVNENPVIIAPEKRSFEFQWSEDGHAVALLIDGTPLGFIIAGRHTGWCRNLAKSCLWGEVFDETLYRNMFKS